MGSTGSEHYDVLVIGGGPGGMSAARFTRRRNQDLRVGLIRAQERSVVPCAMPYALDGTIRFDDFLKSDPRLLGEAGIELRVGRVERIDPESRRVTVSGDGPPEVSYGELVVAVGATPVRPPIPGADLPGTFVVKDAPDIAAIRKAMDEASAAVVVGGGYVGLEVAIAFRNAGLETHVIEMLPVCLGNVCSEGAARLALEELRAHGIRVHTDCAAEEIVGTGWVGGVRIPGGTIPADLVVFAVGVRANTGLLAGAGAETGRLGVKVNDRMQTSLPHVWAVGDCIEHRNFVTGEPAVGPLATNAVVQGKTAAINITGGDRRFPGFINPSVTRLYERSYGSTGLNETRAAAAGIETVVGRARAFTRDRPFPGAGPLDLTLVFERRTHRLIGAECVGAEGVAERIDLLTLAVRHRLTMEDLASMHFCGHPPQTDVPARMVIVNAAEDALRKTGLL